MCFYKFWRSRLASIIPFYSRRADTHAGGLVRWVDVRFFFVCSLLGALSEVMKVNFNKSQVQSHCLSLSIREVKRVVSVTRKHTLRGGFDRGTNEGKRLKKAQVYNRGQNLCGTKGFLFNGSHQELF